MANAIESHRNLWHHAGYFIVRFYFCFWLIADVVKRCSCRYSDQIKLCKTTPTYICDNNPSTLEPHKIFYYLSQFSLVFLFWSCHYHWIIPTVGKSSRRTEFIPFSPMSVHNFPRVEEACREKNRCKCVSMITRDTKRENSMFNRFLPLFIKKFVRRLARIYK